MSANLYRTKRPEQYYHIHGSLEASTTLRMIGLEPFRPDLTEHKDIVDTIESHVEKYTIEELEELNAKHTQAGVPAFKHEEFLLTPHVRPNLLHMILELCRIVAGPTMGRILAEYGADVLKITSPNLSDVPFFQVDGNMGKHAANIDLKTVEGKRLFEELVQDVDVVLDGYRPGALSRLGYGTQFMTELAKKRGHGVVYVNENCFGYEGEWASRPGWQQIADCVTGLAWEQGKFMGIDEPIVPPFPISDYGTGCIGAIAALTGLYNRATIGGSWHGMASLMQYDLLLFKAGLYPADVQASLRKSAGESLSQMRHSHSVDQISGAALLSMQKNYPDSKDISNGAIGAEKVGGTLGQEFTEHVIHAMGPKTNPRLRQVMSSFIQHIHDFAREVQLTTDEWMLAVQVLNEAGKMSNEKRNEGQLVCDVIGLESLVDDITYQQAVRTAQPLTQTAILGPFWRSDTPVRENGTTISFNTPKDGKTAYMFGKITSADTGKGIPNAVVDVWQASTNGLYEQQDDDQCEHNLRGKFITDAEGRYSFYCLRPTPYPVEAKGHNHWQRLKSEPDHIVEISDHTAHLVLIALCKDPGTRQDAMKVIANFDVAEQNRPLSENSTCSTKRKVRDDDVMVCEQCTKIYTEDENSDTACNFHSGQLEPDYDGEVWCDHDEDSHGIIDSDELRREYPEGYI
ncbi:caib baif family enzyme [Grosmannia clavigera kw1407]|uniref:Caib baif family enzyme n=1 Tax=Grosmannia clavigera (strain kw1407 / UAMH 11150) TaxID=655863 RepID=F0XCU2_GROCL|nr:caib baif family enzyme [Grosmannia clavigera kw1407]EFX04776.1 caib baif family enzyme [Grosmannia clavigera kw1407]